MVWFFFFTLVLTSLFDTSGPCLSLTRQASSSFLCTGEREKTKRDHTCIYERNSFGEELLGCRDIFSCGHALSQDTCLQHSPCFPSPFPSLLDVRQHPLPSNPTTPGTPFVWTAQCPELKGKRGNASSLPHGGG